MKVLVYNNVEKKYHLFKNNNQFVKYMNQHNKGDIEIIQSWSFPLGGFSRLTVDDLPNVGLFIFMVSASVLIWPVLLCLVGMI